MRHAKYNVRFLKSYFLRRGSSHVNAAARRGRPNRERTRADWNGTILDDGPFIRQFHHLVPRDRKLLIQEAGHESARLHAERRKPARIRINLKPGDLTHADSASGKYRNAEELLGVCNHTGTA